MTEPLQWRGLTDEERQNPYDTLRGPALLSRNRFGKGPKHRTNLLEDDNPFNDPLKYAPFKGWAFPPSDYAGPDDERETDDMATLASCGNSLQRGFVFGYCGRKARQNVFYNADGRIVYHSAALGIVYDKHAHEQFFFAQHDDDITSLDMHPDGIKIVTGQVGKTPQIYIWSSRPDQHHNLQVLCVIQDQDMKRAIVGVSFSSTGEYIAAMGLDNNRSIAMYKWVANQPASKMRVGLDKGHNADVYQLAYNPVTDHAVAVGKKLVRFFGVKDTRDAALSHHESALWAKKGVFGKRENQQDMMCVAFGGDGITYAGTADGYIYRFPEQEMDLAVKAHPLATEAKETLCKVTALWFNPHTSELLSSGDDGMVQVWQPSVWGSAKSFPQPVRTIDLHRWFGAQPVLRGLPIKLDEFSNDKDEASRKLGSPAAAHSLFGDKDGRILVGTVCNEIYEIDPSTDESPMCYMQGHYNEVWGLATHNSKQEFCTAAEDCTVRVWDLTDRVMKSIFRLPGPGRSCAFSPDGSLIAVGIGAGGRAKGRPNPNQGKWLVFKNDEQHLTLVAEPAQIRDERIADIKFSPDGMYLAVASADNFVDLYSVNQTDNETSFEHKATFQGHSSYVRKVDWSDNSKTLQSCCGAYELLYWRLFKGESDEQKWRPHQEKTSSKLRDEKWATHDCLFGWPLRGIWPEDSDGTDINAVSRTRGASSSEGLVATADDFGKVKLFRWPCIVPRAQAKEYMGHSSHVTNVSFTAGDESLISTGGNDRAIIQWQVVRSAI